LWTNFPPTFKTPTPPTRPPHNSAGLPLSVRGSAAIILTFRHCGEWWIMAKSKEARSHVKLVSTESSYTYFVEKNRNNTKERLQLRKYDPTLRKHVIFKETK
jgi:large subunit ribosomal protein L33